MDREREKYHTREREEFAEEMEVKVKTGIKKPHFVLVHGISGGGWCWYKLRCLMENGGYTVSCIDLKGCGIDQTDPNTILSFKEYNNPLIQFLSSLNHQDQKVILVGHSAGGLSLTDAIHKFRKKISLAVYVAATMLKLGYVTEEDIKDGVPDLSEFGKIGDVYNIDFGQGMDNPPTGLLIKAEMQRQIIYQLSPQEDSTLAAMLLRPGPIQALKSAKFEEGEDADEVPRIYIKTSYDHVMKPQQQDAMIKKWPPTDVYVLESDHSPFFSAPFTLFGLLIKAAISAGCI